MIAPESGTSPFSLVKAEKERRLLAGLNELTRHHQHHSPAYANVVNAIFQEAGQARFLADLPWIPVQLFKRIELRSVPRDAVVKTLTSSGTSGQAPSHIFLDRETASSQSRTLVTIASEFLGKGRLPMLIIDDSSLLKDRARFNARAAGILGFSTLGRDHAYLLNERLEPDWDSLNLYLEKHCASPILLFGFTFIVWQSFVQAARREGVRFPFPEGSVLVHGGGWKRLEDQQVSEEAFKAALAETFGIARVHNYYGMVEQVGSIYFECERGWLHTPTYSDILIRDPMTLEPLPSGATGIVQVLSLLPKSYPGHSLLTEDLGTIYGEDDCACGRLGKYFKIHGRLKNVEMRGCSDTRVLPAA